MSTCNCRNHLANTGGEGSIPSPPTPSHHWLPQTIGLLEWILPTATLGLIPKCPMCVAAYIALGTGIGISASTAWYLRTSLITLCIMAISYLAARKVGSLIASLRSKA